MLPGCLIDSKLGEPFTAPTARTVRPSAGTKSSRGTSTWATQNAAIHPLFVTAPWSMRVNCCESSTARGPGGCHDHIRSSIPHHRGRDLRGVEPASRGNGISLRAQIVHTVLFRGIARDGIASGHPCASEDEIVHAARLANAEKLALTANHRTTRTSEHLVLGRDGRFVICRRS
jgi:hypothetical protein